MKKPDTKSRRKDLAMQILKYIAFGAMIGSVLVCPNLAQLYKLLDADDSPQRRRVRYNLQKLQKQGFLKESDAGTAFSATARGIREAEYDQLTITSNKWDRKWRLFMFDIPESMKASRLILSRKVQEMGMRSFQKSIFISPYPCEDVLYKATKFLQVEKYTRLAIATKISDENHFKKMFGL